MTLGEKIREARRKCGFSQEQLAEKMSVSRSAVAKWETDKGLPDVGNLKILAKLLNVSVDQLLDEGQSANTSVIRENIHLASYGYGCKRVQKDRLVREKYPDATIYPLLGRQEPMDLKNVSGNCLDCHTDPLASLTNEDKSFYLVEKENRQILVTVTDTFVETRPLEHPIKENSFTFHTWHFIKCNYTLSDS